MKYVATIEFETEDNILNLKKFKNIEPGSMWMSVIINKFYTGVFAPKKLDISEVKKGDIDGISTNNAH